MSLAMKNKEKKDNALYENSVKVVANLIKMSSFSLAKMSLGKIENDPVKPRKLEPARSFVMVANNPVLRSQEPVTNKKKIYLVEPDEGYKSNVVEEDMNVEPDEGYESKVIKEDMNVDGKASEYIRKVHEKNQNDLRLIPKLS